MSALCDDSIVFWHSRSIIHNIVDVAHGNRNARGRQLCESLVCSLLQSRTLLVFLNTCMCEERTRARLIKQLIKCSHTRVLRAFVCRASVVACASADSVLLRTFEYNHYCKHHSQNITCDSSLFQRSRGSVFTIGILVCMLLVCLGTIIVCLWSYRH